MKKRKLLPKIQKNQRKRSFLAAILVTTFSLLIKSTHQKNKCVVDSCVRCRYTNIDTCDQCDSGYFKVTFWASQKRREYNACWSYMKLFWWLAVAAALSLCYLYLCCRCYQKGRRTIRIVNKKRPKQIIKDERTIQSQESSSKKKRHIVNNEKPQSSRREFNQPSTPRASQPPAMNNFQPPGTPGQSQQQVIPPPAYPGYPGYNYGYPAQPQPYQGPPPAPGYPVAQYPVMRYGVAPQTPVKRRASTAYTGGRFATPGPSSGVVQRITTPGRV